MSEDQMHAVTAMNVLPDISDGDSERLREFVKVTSREVKAVGGASAGTTLEMIGYIRELERKLCARASVAAVEGDVADVLKVLAGRHHAEHHRQFPIETCPAWPCDILRAAASSPAPAEPKLIDCVLCHHRVTTDENGYCTAMVILRREGYPDDLVKCGCHCAPSDKYDAEPVQPEGEQGW